MTKAHKDRASLEDIAKNLDRIATVLERALPPWLPLKPEEAPA